MPGLLDFVNKDIVSSETIEHTLLGQINWGKRSLIKIYCPHKKAIYSEPVLCLKLKDNYSKIEDLSCLVKRIDFEVGGYTVDQMFTEQINTLQHKHNIISKQYGNTILIPLPFNCLLKKNGIIINKIDYYEARIIIELIETNKIGDIFTGCMYLNYTYIKEDTDLSELTMLNYNEFKNTKFHEDTLLKINNKLPSDFISYYFITELLNNKNKNICMTNIYEIPCENNAFSDKNILIERPPLFNIPITLLKINQSQFTGEEILPYGDTAKFNLLFVNDITSLYLQFKLRDDKNVLNDKWFDNIQICVNGQKVLEYTYEMLCLYKHNNIYNLPNGVLEIPNMKYVNIKGSEFILILTNIKHHQDTSTTVYIFAESENYLVNSSQSKLLFRA